MIVVTVVLMVVSAALAFATWRVIHHFTVVGTISLKELNTLYRSASGAPGTRQRYVGKQFVLELDNRLELAREARNTAELWAARILTTTVSCGLVTMLLSLSEWEGLANVLAAQIFWVAAGLNLIGLSTVFLTGWGDSLHFSLSLCSRAAQPVQDLFWSDADMVMVHDMENWEVERKEFSKKLAEGTWKLRVFAVVCLVLGIAHGLAFMLLT